MSDTKIITTVHWKLPKEAQDYFEANKDLYQLVFAGGTVKLDKLNDKWLKEHSIPDDACTDNISHLNPVVNEWTSIYLMFKNLRLLPSSTANIGHNHYRRFFTPEQLANIDTVDGILAEPIPLGVAGYPTVVRKQYELCHYKEDFDTLESVLKSAPIFYGDKLYDEETWEQWTQLPYLFAPCNLFVFKREVFNLFCHQIMPIMFKLVTVIDLKGRDDYQKRACGFLSERLTSYWCWKKMVKNGYRFIVHKPIEKLDWKPEKSTDCRGHVDGVFKGDQTMLKVDKWVKEHNQ